MAMEQSKERLLAVISHLGGLVVVCFLPIVIPFLVWVLKGDQSEFVNLQAKEALNFQLSLIIYEVACGVLIFTVIGAPVALIAGVVFVITNIICSIVGAFKTSRGITYKYPMNLRLIQ